MWLKMILFTILGLVVIISGAIFFGSVRWQTETLEVQRRLETSASPTQNNAYSSELLERLPPPVQRFFRVVLPEGQPLIGKATIAHEGQFNMEETGERWAPFTSKQISATSAPGFLWDARIRMGPGINVFVHDGYIGGEGLLYGKLLGLMSVVNEPQTPELAHGELMRYLAEAAWYPTALLPSQGVHWEAIDESSAYATLTDGSTRVTLEFHFNEEGFITSVRSDGRFRSVDGEQIATPWEGRFWAYQEQDGMKIPTEGEVAWLLPEGRAPYWRARIKHIEYDWTK